MLFLIAIIALTYFVPIDKVESPKVKHKWDTMDSKAYARDKLSAWETKQWKCLDKLWTRESNWRHDAYNKTKVMGLNAGGIPQLLGLSPISKPTYQIDRGLDYIMYRYTTPCRALRFHKKNWWY